MRTWFHRKIAQKHQRDPYHAHRSDQLAHPDPNCHISLVIVDHSGSRIFGKIGLLFARQERLVDEERTPQQSLGTFD